MAFHKARALQEAEKSVAQGKTAQAIKQYQEILDNDPSDVSLLNTVGDLYIRDRNITEGLRQFHRLAEAYVREGFNLKAIAIYRKISKVDPNSIDTLLKLGELYQLQGLSREAREQYLQAAEFFKKRHQTDRVQDVLRKLVQLDPENLNFRNRMAAEYEQAGRREDAAKAHLESAEILLHRNDQAGAETALKKAAELDPQNSKIQIFRARVAIGRGQPEEAERIINASPDLQSDIAGKRVLLDAYLGSGKLPEAEKLVLEVFHSNHADFAPVSSVSALLVEKGDIDKAHKLLASVAEPLIDQNNVGPLLEALRRIWSKAPQHIPTLELIHRVCERTADELTLPEVLEALGRAHEQAGDMEEAEAAYVKLTDREPENENYRGLLNSVQRKLGKEIKPEEFSAHEMALSVDNHEEEEIASKAAVVDTVQERMVNEALENSDLFSRYNLTEKAIAELEKVLQSYPDQIEVHRRILEISHKGFPERAAAAAAQLARIFAERGDVEMASKYRAIAAAKGASYEIMLPPPPPSEKMEEPVAPLPAPPETPEEETASELPISLHAPEESAAAAPAAPLPEEVPFELTPEEVPLKLPAAPLPPPVLTEPTMELDLSGDLEALTAIGSEPPAPAAPRPVALLPEEAPARVEIPAFPEEPAPSPVVQEATPTAGTPAGVPEPLPGFVEEKIPVDLEDSRIEVEFYLDNGFLDEARQTVTTLEGKYPGNPFVAELRRRLDERADESVPAEPLAQISPADEPGGAAPALEVAEAEPEAALPPVPAPLAEEPAQEEWELPTSYAVPPQAEPTMNPVVSTPLAEPDLATEPGAPPPVVEPAVLPSVAGFATPPHPPAPVVEEPVAAKSGGTGRVGDFAGQLAGDLASSLEGSTASAEASQSAPAASSMFAPPPPGPPQGAAQLDGLLAEMEDSGAAAADRDDPETHYSLGVAFREMGLLDEAIGEFQKLVMGAGKGNYPPNFLQVCSLLAICFMEKKMPALAVRWYKRALETPGLDEEAQMALQYDLGLAYEQAGDARHALERFTEVYSQNIDFRDVADKIRELQQKA